MSIATGVGRPVANGDQKGVISIQSPLTNFCPSPKSPHAPATCRKVSSVSSGRGVCVCACRRGLWVSGTGGRQAVPCTCSGAQGQKEISWERDFLTLSTDRKWRSASLLYQTMLLCPLIRGDHVTCLRGHGLCLVPDVPLLCSSPPEGAGGCVLTSRTWEEALGLTFL